MINQVNRITAFGWLMFIVAAIGAAAMIAGALALLLRARAHG